MYLEPATHKFTASGAPARDAEIPLAKDLEKRLTGAPVIKKMAKAQGKMQLMSTRYVDVTELVGSVGELRMTIAMAILTEKTGKECALHKDDATGKRFLIQGDANGILIAKPYGPDMVVHTHPQKGEEYAWPSPNDVGTLQSDPDKKAAW